MLDLHVVGLLDTMVKQRGCLKFHAAPTLGSQKQFVAPGVTQVSYQMKSSGLRRYHMHFVQGKDLIPVSGLRELAS